MRIATGMCRLTMERKRLPMKKNLKGDLIPGIVATLFGVIVLLLTLTGSDMAILVAKKRGSIPGPGFFPCICAVLTIVFGIALSLRGLRQNGTVNFFEMTDEMRSNVKIAALVLLGLVCFLVLWKLTNLFIPLVFVYAVYLNILFKRNWVFTAAFSVIITAFIYLLFVRGFSVMFKV